LREAFALNEHVKTIAMQTRVNVVANDSQEMPVPWGFLEFRKI